MRFTFIDTYYPSFLIYFRKKYPDFCYLSYQKQLQKLLDECFGTSNFYSVNLKLLGHSSFDLVVNDQILQRQWIKEKNLKIKASLILSEIQAMTPLRRILGYPNWLFETALAQIEEINPDICYIQDLNFFTLRQLLTIKKKGRLIIGQIASGLPAVEYLNNYDLILTSFPHYIARLRRMGIRSEYFRIGFEKTILDRIGSQEKKYQVTFIGSFTQDHKQGTEILENVAQKVGLDLWGSAIPFASPFSSLRKVYRGEAWGLDMYRILSQSKIVINRHSDLAENYANNMRLYETTGMGAMLVTDDKKNLNELFKAGREVETYRSADELIYKIKYYLKDNNKRQKIALAGQKKTLTEHTYFQRMKELLMIISKYL